MSAWSNVKVSSHTGDAVRLRVTVFVRLPTTPVTESLTYGLGGVAPYLSVEWDVEWVATKKR
jgi:hypothetical protein